MLAYAFCLLLLVVVGSFTFRVSFLPFTRCGHGSLLGIWSHTISLTHFVALLRFLIKLNGIKIK